MPNIYNPFRNVNSMIPTTRTGAIRSLKPTIKVSYFEDHEIEAIFEAINKRITTEKGNRSLFAMRYRLLLKTLLRTGARIEEVVRYERKEYVDTQGKVHKYQFFPGIVVKDIDTTLNTISILTLKKSGGKPHRILPLHPDLKDEFLGYSHEMRNRLPFGPKDPLFPMSRVAVDHFMTRLERDLGFRVNAHKFRHTFAVRALLDGVPVNVLQKWLAHSSLIVTSVYADVVGMDTSSFMNQMH